MERAATPLLGLRPCRFSTFRTQKSIRWLDPVGMGSTDSHPENVRAKKADVLWRDARLIVEVDGFAFHSDARAFEQDRQRDFLLTSTGLRVVRITWKQLVQQPEVVLVQLAQMLVQR
jgi:hypothetical protein